MITRNELPAYIPAILTGINIKAGDRLTREQKDDLVQDVFLGALEHMAGDGIVTAAWLKLRAESRTLNALKAAHNNREESFEEWHARLDTDEDNSSVPPSLLDLDTPEGLYAVREFIKDMSDEDKEMLEMLVEGMTQQEVADVMGLDQASISRRLECFRRQLGE